MRQLWYESHLLATDSGKAARRQCAGLGPNAHEKILAIGDRLARESATLAQRFYCNAAEAYVAFGDQFDRWVATGEQLAAQEPSVREGAAAYFEVPISTARAIGLDGLGRWTRAGTSIATASRKLASIFLETTAPLLRTVSLDRLEAWADVALDLHSRNGWHGEFLAQAYLGAAAHALATLDPEQYALWAKLGVGLRRIIKEADFFGVLPAGLRRWSSQDRRLWLRCALQVADDAPKAAAVFYREAPRALRKLAASRRTQVLTLLYSAGPAIAAGIEDLVPVLGAVVLDVPPAKRTRSLALAQRIADVFPHGVIPALRSLPKAFEESSPEGVADWVERGLEIAKENNDAGVAYFSLVSRTSLKILRASSTGVALEEVQGVFRKLIQMLSGEPASIKSSEGRFSLRPPLEEFPAESEVALPLRIDCLSTHESNARLYRVLAAWLAGRREFGTYDFDPLARGDGPGLVAYLRREDHPELLEEVFLVAEGYRVARRVMAEYPGLGVEFRWAAERMLVQWTGQYPQVPDAQIVLDAALALALGGTEAVPPAWADTVVPAVLPCLAPLGSPSATAADALRVAEQLTARLLDAKAPRRPRQDQFEFGGLVLERVSGETLIDPYADDDAALPPDDDAPRVPVATAQQPDAELPADLRLRLDHTPDDMPGGAQPLSLDEIRRLLEQGADLKIKQGTADDVDGIGLYITDLIGKIPSAQLEELRRLLGDSKRTRTSPRRWTEEHAAGPSFLYDEWDYHIADYRSRWCRLREISLESDGGEFFHSALAEYAAMIPEVRQQFQRIRPEMYRLVRGLEDGEDFDLNAAVTARVEFRARRSPSTKLYVARKREERDVTTLFLLDMSASTDEPLEKAPRVYPDDGDDWQAALRGRSVAATPRRIIDVTKEALVIMAQALEEIGDAYAIYGFSGQGRQNIEFYLVKSFSEPLTSTVKGRIGGIVPKRSTRMGTALRHAVEKMNAINSRSKHLILLSDGFPQDFDYGQDRRSNVYGIRDTAVALRETEAAGITPFCITVDRAGHDYLRQMCDESRYLVIEDINTLPKELPKIYQRVVRADW
jgi:nitric oxide reductase NorD protein